MIAPSQEVVRVEFPLQAQQKAALRALRDPAVREVMYGGAKGGGKSHLGCVWMFTEAMADIERYGLDPCDYPIATGYMGRSKSTLFTKTTLETWKRIIPAQYYRIREVAKQIVVMGAVAIDFGGMDPSEGIQKFNSAEYGHAWIDQGEEVSQNDSMALRASLRLRINDQFPAYKLLFTVNPARCWLRDEFILAPKSYQRYIPALPSDNRFLPPTYVEQIKDAYSHRPELIEAYLHGRWDVFESMYQVIRERDVEAARFRKFYPTVRHKLIVCDPARFGDDETVIYAMDETEVVKEEIYGQEDAMHTANHLFVAWREFEAELVAIDSIGIGGPIGDRVKEMGVPVLMIDSAEKAGDAERYVNLRAEMWDMAGRMFSDGEIALSHDDATLRGQLCTPTYDFRAGRMIIQDKKEIKTLLGRSPDRADTYVYGLHGLRYLRREYTRPSPGVKFFKPVEKTTEAPVMSYAGRRKAWEQREKAKLVNTW